MIMPTDYELHKQRSHPGDADVDTGVTIKSHENCTNFKEESLGKQNEGV